MLCSRCSEPVLPVVAIDIDGTLGDYHGHFLRFAADWLSGNPLPKLLEGSIEMYGGVEKFSDYCCRLFDIDLTTYRQIKLAYRQGGMKRTMPIYPGAAQMMRIIAQGQVEIFITTARPYLSLDTVVPDTVEWCERHRIPYNAMLFDDDKYEQLAERVDSERVIAVVDDTEEMVWAANSLFPDAEVILRRNPFNNNVAWIPCIEDLWQIGDEIVERAISWNRSHLQVH